MMGTVSLQIVLGEVCMSRFDRGLYSASIGSRFCWFVLSGRFLRKELDASNDVVGLGVVPL